ncbi:DUF2177 family protein [Novosphingobium sp. Gsoil 351]|uniref:DUF2177 family protein n=1 Tax=Novosphingobium sp. Gsoil 351 TaxID=2675225 RepID=UPI0012B4A2FC|nr:DUF2177 family protein [Novosphingobium sp. Gsoil 351]QGN53805.1 DUF2177 family protein [Novosphingobium sp. Gsoil 351]
MKWIIAYVAAGLSFGALDAVWLGWAGKNLYRPALGELLAPSFRPAPAIAFYLLYIAALVWFAVRAGHTSGLGGGIGIAALNGALFGAICYATYDLTNQATMKVWPVHVTLIDIAWGAFASAVAAAVGFWAMARLG